MIEHIDQVTNEAGKKACFCFAAFPLSVKIKVAEQESENHHL